MSEINSESISYGSEVKGRARWGDIAHGLGIQRRPSGKRYPKELPLLENVTAQIEKSRQSVEPVRDGQLWNNLFGSCSDDSCSDDGDGDLRGGGEDQGRGVRVRVSGGFGAGGGEGHGVRVSADGIGRVTETLHEIEKCK